MLLGVECGKVVDADGALLEEQPHECDPSVVPDVCDRLGATAGEVEVCDLPPAQHPDRIKVFRGIRSPCRLPRVPWLRRTCDRPRAMIALRHRYGQALFQW